jgi:hypothetical protein
VTRSHAAIAAIAAIALATALVAAPSASAAEPLFTGDGTPLAAPQLAAAGEVAVAAWSEAEGGQVWTAVRRAGAWSSPTALPVTAPAYVWDVAVDGRGTALVAVVERPGAARARIRVFAAGANGAWTASPQLAPAAARFVRGVTLAAAADGTVVVAFERYDPPNGRSVVMAATRAPGAAWRPAVAVGRPGPADEYGLDPDGAAGTRGRAVVVWSDRGGPIVAAARSAGGRWGDATKLAAHGYGPRVALAPDGRGLATWASTDFRGQRITVRARTAAGSWGPPRTVPGPRGSSGGGPALAVGAGGRALLAVGRGEGSTLAVHVATRGRRGAFTALRRLPQPMVFPSPVVPAPAVDALTASAGVAWVAGNRVRLVSRRPGGSWSAVRSLGPTSRAPSLAAAGGRLLVGWVESGDRIVVREVRP